MSKKQIRISQDEIRKLVRESIQDKLNGVFSTDDPKAAEAVRNDFDPYELYYGEDDGTRRSKETFANLIDKRANGEDAELGLPNYDRFQMKDDFDSSKEEAEMYEKNPEGEENLYIGDPDLEEPDEEEPYQIYEGKRVRMNESGLRNFISYSVSKLLKEAMGKDLYYGDEYDGYEESPYGNDSSVIDFDPEDDEDMDMAFESVLAESEFAGNINPEMLNGVWPVMVKIYYSRRKEEGGDTGEWIENTNVDDWKADLSHVPEEFKPFVEKVIANYFEGGFFNSESLNENMGTLTHFGKKESEEAAEKYPNPYKDLTWDEYCDAKRQERLQDKTSEDMEDDDNLGIKAHFATREKPEIDPEKESHMFDDEYWQDKSGIQLTGDELREMVKRTVTNVLKEIAQ